MRSGPPASTAGAYQRLEQLRWGGPPQTCPLCGTTGRCFFLHPRSGQARPTRTGAPSERRVWKCGACRRQFSVLAGTILQGTRIALPAWIAALRDWAEPGPRPTAAELAARHGLSRAAARHVARRLDLAAARLPDVPPGGEMLAALLRLPAADAAWIRARTPTRVRPRRQDGPSADYGAG